MASDSTSKGQYVCYICDDLQPVDIEIGKEDDGVFPYIRITGLHIHMDETLVKLPEVYITTERQLKVT